jgi:hypothetical protein
MSRRRALGMLLTVAGAAAAMRQLGPVPTRPVGYFAPIPGERVPWGSFAGLVEEPDLYLVVVIDTTGAAVAHACDAAGNALWLTGRSDGAIVSLHTGPAEPAVLLTAVMAVSRGSTAATGVLAVRGTSYPFALSRTDPGGGLFAATTVVGGVPQRAIWIALDARRQRGVVTMDGRAMPAPPMPADRAAVRLDRLTPKWGRLPVAALHAAGSP